MIYKIIKSLSWWLASSQLGASVGRGGDHAYLQSPSYKKVKFGVAIAGEIGVISLPAKCRR